MRRNRDKSSRSSDSSAREKLPPRTVPFPCVSSESRCENRPMVEQLKGAEGVGETRTGPFKGRTQTAVSGCTCRDCDSP